MKKEVCKREHSAEFEIQQAWQKYQTVEKRGLDFGRVCYEQRAKAEVVQGGTSFSRMLDKLGIPRRTAYYWINSYELSIGERESVAPTPIQPNKPKQVHISGDENTPLFWKTLGNKLNALLPTYSDGSEHTMVTMLEQAYTEPLSKDTTVLKSIVVMLKRLSSEYAEHAQKLEARMKFEEIAEIVQVEEQMAPPSGGVSIPTSPLQYRVGSC